MSLETPHRKPEDVLSELMWVDDLKNDVTNVCQPIPSLGHRMVERIPAGDNVYLVTMFRKANGAIFSDADWDTSFFYNAGKLLGKIHRTSHEGYTSEYQLPDEQWELFDEFFRLRIVQAMSVQIFHQLYSREIILALNEPSFAYLQRDKSPIDRLDEVATDIRSRMTQEQRDLLIKSAMG